MSRARQSRTRTATVGMIATAHLVLATAGALANGESPSVAYRLHCQGCHFEDGMGTKEGGVPPLPGVAGHFLKHDMGRLYLIHVPGVTNAGLPDDETAALLNYVLTKWGAKELPANFVPFTGEEVHSLRQQPLDDITKLRRNILSDLEKRGIKPSN